MKEISFDIFPSLQTERLMLRQLKATDVDAIYGLRSNKEINKLITRETTSNLSEASEFITICHQEFKKGNRIFWAMELKETNQIIGTIVFHNISLKDSYAEIGYELHPMYHKRGYMNEAMQHVLNYGTTLGFTIIEAFTHKNNIASIALLKKHHFVFQPDRRCEHVENNRIFRLKVNSYVSNT